MKIYLIRHGETDYNKQRLFYGLTDISINLQGIDQALLLREKLVALPQQIPVFTSSLKRTVETAKLIFPEHKLNRLSEFNEKSFGLWEGLNADQIQEKFPDEWTAWLEDTFEVTPPKAENYAEFKQRVLSCFEKLLGLQQEAIVIVGHLGVLRVILAEYFPEKSFWEIELDQGNYTMISCDNSAFRIEV